VIEPTEIAARTGKPNEETINVLTKSECFAIMVPYLPVGYSSICKSDKKPKVVAAFLEEAHRRNGLPLPVAAAYNGHPLSVSATF
jgi:hypothetical protein